MVYNALKASQTACFSPQCSGAFLSCRPCIAAPWHPSLTSGDGLKLETPGSRGCSCPTEGLAAPMQLQCPQRWGGGRGAPNLIPCADHRVRPPGKVGTGDAAGGHVNGIKSDCRALGPVVRGTGPWCCCGTGVKRRALPMRASRWLQDWSW